jgi:hypothetical protein
MVGPVAHRQGLLAISFDCTTPFNQFMNIGGELALLRSVFACSRNARPLDALEAASYGDLHA